VTSSIVPAPFTDQLRDALASRDLEAFGALLSDDVRWGDDSHPRGCRNRSEVLKTFARALSAGVDGTVSELESGPQGILCRFDVTRPEGDLRADDLDVFHVYLVSNGQIVQILRFFDRESAANAAGLSD
jgi:ketosteroid isomerase-like protein